MKKVFWLIIFVCLPLWKIMQSTMSLFPQVMCHLSACPRSANRSSSLWERCCYWLSLLWTPPTNLSPRRHSPNTCKHAFQVMTPNHTRRFLLPVHLSPNIIGLHVCVYSWLKYVEICDKDVWRMHPPMHMWGQYPDGNIINKIVYMLASQWLGSLPYRRQYSVIWLRESVLYRWHC